MHLACSSVLSGGGTNQELAHHCLYECKGDIMVSTTEQSVLACRTGGRGLGGSIDRKKKSLMFLCLRNLIYCRFFYMQASTYQRH